MDSWRPRRRVGNTTSLLGMHLNGCRSAGRRRVMWFWGALLAVGLLGAAPRQDTPPESGSDRAVRLIPLTLPITDRVKSDFRRSLDKTLAELPPRGERPVLIVEFLSESDNVGEGSDFGAALSLARDLSSDRLSHVRTVAYLPNTVLDHAVLPVLACEQIVIAPNAEFGDACASEKTVDPIIAAAYLEIARRSGTLPPAIVRGMVDPRIAVLRVRQVDGSEGYFTDNEFARLESEGRVAESWSIIPAGDLGRFTGRQLRLDYRWASHLVENDEQLAAELEIPLAAVRREVDLGESWVDIGVPLDGRISAGQVDQIQMGLEEKVRSGTNFVCLMIDSPGGSPIHALRLAGYLSDLDSSQVRTVSYVEHECRSVAAVIAMACDDLVVTDQARLGGPGDRHVGKATADDLVRAIRQIAEAKNRDWSLLAALAYPDLPVFRFNREGTGEARYLCDEEWSELDDGDAWKRGPQLDLGDGLTGIQAVELGLARGTAHNLDELRQQYGLEGQFDTIRQSWLVNSIQRLASEAWFARTLLFIAFFALMSETSAPGLGVPGFVAGLSFLLFFWCQFLNGTAGWLEVVLFVGGMSCIALEIFVIPGMGVFGVGGGVMVLASIVLASQTFVVPRNSYQIEQLPESLLMLVAGGGGAFTALWIVRKYIADAPVLRRMMLHPPQEPDELDRRESLSDWSFLAGKRGKTTTPLSPAGKARFADDIVNVISEGEMIPVGTDVVVADVRGSRILVERADTR